MSEVTVSVVIPCYNASRFLPESLASVLAQGRDDVQIIVVDDGSEDIEELRRVVEEYEDAVELIEERHCGLPATRNRGIVQARGRYVAFLDADDEWKDDFLGRQLEQLERTGADLVYCDAELFGESGPYPRTFMDRYPSRGEANAESVIMRRCNVVLSSVVARTDMVRGVGGFDPDRPYGEDFDLWLRMLIAGARFTYHHEPLARRRIHEGNMSQNAVGMMENVIEVTDRHAPDIRLSRADRRQLNRRQRAARGALHHARAVEALEGNDDVQARREFWAAVRRNPSIRRLVVAVVFTLVPRLAGQIRERRGEPSQDERA